MLHLAFFMLGNDIGGGGMVATQNAINILKLKHKITIFVEKLHKDSNRHLLNIGKIKIIEVGKMLLGEWQSIFLIEFDPIREREIIFTYM